MLNRSSLTPTYPASLSDCLIQTDPLPKFDDIGAIARQFYPDCIITTRGYDFRGDTYANPETYEAATRDPEKYDLLRARMGGWSEFFVTMFPARQAQHQRRPLRRPDPVAA
jgi:hypothetical protein